MTGAETRVLTIDDLPSVHAAYRQVLEAREATELPELEAILKGMETGTSGSVATAFRVDSALSGEDALALTQNALEAGRPYSVVFSDVRMPGGWDGVATVRRLWDTDPNLQVVLCTAYTDYTWEELASALGRRSDFVVLKKPFDPIELRQLAEAMAERRSLREAEAFRVAELEREVERRTASLIQSNEQLRTEIRERERLQDDLFRVQRLEALGRLTAAMAHEINNPLFVVSGSLFNLSQILEERGTEDEKADVDLALAACERIKDIVARVQAFGRKDESPMESVSVKAFVDFAVEMVGTRLRHRTALHVDVPPTLTVVGRSRQLEQIVLNLLVNAEQALCRSQEENEIRVTARVDGPSVLLAVTDNGTGIEAEHLEYVFEPFFTTKPTGMGTGLGLAICHSMVAAMGGDMTVDSEPGEGTTVSVFLRLSGEPPAVHETEEEEVDVSGGARILLVDDDQLVRRVMRRYLRAYDVDEAGGVDEALEQCRAVRYDVIFCDVMMPERSGLEFLEELEALRPADLERVVMVTGGIFDLDQSVLTDRRRDLLLKKPFSGAALRAAAEKLIREGRDEVSR